MTTSTPAGAGPLQQLRPRLVRSGWAVRVPSARPAEQPGVEPLIAAHRAACPGGDLAEIRRAYAVAERQHRGAMRKSGAPYITHPLAVAMILAALGMDTTTLVAALLHDTVEDTPYTLGEVRADFGEDVAVLVDGVTKLDGERWGDRAEAETFRKMVLAAAADLRVLVIKLADRLHNLRTLGFQPPHKRERIAKASLELLVPFAERLGIYVLKREMDDLAFAALHPEAYARTHAAAEAAMAVRPGLEPALGRMRACLADHDVAARVITRPRHLYAVHVERDGDVAGLRPTDVARVLVLVDGSEQDCYVALGAVHSAFHPITGRVKDFIALPKYNLYRSLHTVVIGPEGDMLDVIIRSRAMHPVAEYGIIEHIRETGGDAVTGRRDLGWLGRLLAWQSDVPSADFLDNLRVDLSGGNLPALTPSGEVVALPRGATAIDFAYALGPDTGDHCIGAVINGRLAALSAEVRSGYLVEILTAPEAGPSADWLEFAKAAQTRAHIQHWLARRAADEAAVTGRHRLVRALADRDIDLLVAEGSGSSLSIARGLGYTEIDEMYAALAAGSLSLGDLLPRFARP
ncbi:MAG TPA: HD domain-containing protein [Streptosporangiaceae bacterium]|jgi:GTP pyrophosphokinase